MKQRIGLVEEDFHLEWTKKRGAAQAKPAASASPS